MLVIATTEPDFYSEKKFNAWLEMADSIGNVSVLVKEKDTSYYKNAIDSIFPEGHLYNIIKDKKEGKFNLVQIVDNYPLSQKKIDSISKVISNLSFYEDIV